MNGVLEKPPLKVLLLENIHQTAIETMTKEGLVVETVPKSLPKDQLIARPRWVQVLGIRSKTHLTAEFSPARPACKRSAASVSAPTRSI